MSGIIIDASVVLAWYFRDEKTAAIDAIWRRTDAEQLTVPTHWFAEVGNGMLAGERRRRSTAAQATLTIELLAAMDIAVDGHGTRRALTAILPLARQYGLTVYDAAYLELAMRLSLPLATLDTALAAAARAAGVVVVDLMGDAGRAPR